MLLMCRLASTKPAQGAASAPSVRLRRLLVGVVAFDAMLFLEGELDLLQLVHDLVDAQKIFHRLHHQGLQLGPQAVIVSFQVWFHAGLRKREVKLSLVTGGDFKGSARSTGLGGGAEAMRMKFTTASGAARGPYWRSGPTTRCSSP